MIICSSFRFNLFTLCAASLQGSSMWLPHSKQVVISVSQIKVRLYTFSVPQGTPVTRYYASDNLSYRNLPPTVFPDLSAHCSLPPPLDSVILYRPQPPFLPRLSPSSDLAWIREFPLIWWKKLIRSRHLPLPFHLVCCLSPGKLHVIASFETSREICGPNQSMLVLVLCPSSIPVTRYCTSDNPSFRNLPPHGFPRFVCPLPLLTALGFRDLVPFLILLSCLAPPPPLI